MSSATKAASKFSPLVLFVLLTLLASVTPGRAANAPETIAVLDSVASDSVITAGHVVYVDFWASWCLPCRRSFPWMKDMLDRYRDKGLQVVTVNLDRNPKAARKFLAEMDSPLPVVFDASGSLAKLYHLQVMPTSFIYGRDGKLKTRHEGFRPEETAAVESQIQSLLAEGSKR